MSKKRKIILIVTLSVVLAILVAVAVILMTIFLGPKHVAEVPIENSGKSSVLQTDKSPEELTPENVAYAYIYKMSEIQSYKLESSGATVASLMGYRQEVSDLGYKFGDVSYLQNISRSPFANVNHEAYVKTVDGASKVAYRDDGGNISVSDRDGENGYKSVYGITPDELAIGGFIFNSNTIKVAEKLEGSNRHEYKEKYAEDFQYHYSLKCTDETTALSQLQMVKYGELSKAPEFSEIELYLTISPNWEPRELITHVVYETAKKIGVEVSLSCTQDVTATYTEVNAITENPIPDAQKFNEAISLQTTAGAHGVNSVGEAAVAPEDLDISGLSGKLIDAFTSENRGRAKLYSKPLAGKKGVFCL